MICSSQLQAKAASGPGEACRLQHTSNKALDLKSARQAVAAGQKQSASGLKGENKSNTVATSKSALE